MFILSGYWRHTEVAVKIIPPQSANKKLIEELMQEAKLMLYVEAVLEIFLS
jgi:hypothetical protein